MNLVRLRSTVFAGICSLLFGFAGLSVLAARVPDAADDVVALVRGGKAAELAKIMTSTVEISVLGDENVYSRVQAEAVLKDFFQKHPPSAAKVVHKLTSNPSYRFTVLMLTTSSGIYRVSYAMKNNDGTFLLTEMRFEVYKE